ncbi:hypothetical protein Tsubulata_029563 [Turnera subulata]|uniref:Cupin type-1 domain-containing protein n=1 Tax=Turnera subulata TaxID=218843 RepID=A0A9Q0FHW4_9ROSI|nr:hypothetical protein Tsubulata_029563 [Turnera subulata]
MSMVVKMKVVSLVLLVTLLVLCTGLALAKKDPELKVCKHQCRAQQQFSEEEKERCIEGCYEYIKQKEGREREARERGEEKEREREIEEGGSTTLWEAEWAVATDPEKKLRQCQAQCERQEGQQRALCRFRCREKYERQHGREEMVEGEEEEIKSSKRGKEGQEGENPYVFEDRHFTSKFKTEQGRVDVLERFNKRSELLRGLENFRLATLDVAPRTFTAPAHFDADVVFFVARGKGTITIFHEAKKESFNLQYGDIFALPSGTPAYLVNSDENERLHLVKFYCPVNLPGKFETFHGPGGENPETFFNAFSSELLEAAYKTDKERFERIFRQRQGPFIKASKEQIEALSHGEEGGSGGGIWPFPGELSGPFRLTSKRPVRANNYGQLFDATPKDYPQLKDFNLIVSFANITQGSMIAFVVDGEGWFEMACPHLSSSAGPSRQYPEQRGESGQRFKKVSARLRPGTVFVVPAGHPEITAASENSNLKVVCFNVNAKGNRLYSLAGRKNFVSMMDNEAKELAFGVPAREVDQIFRSQTEEFFFPGPRQHRRGRAYA